MAYGVQQQIGIGAAQVLPEGPSYAPIVQQFAQQKREREEKERYDAQVKKRDEKELYDLVGDTLNLRDFNPVIHDRVRKAQRELTQTILANPNMGRGDFSLAAQNKAGELGQISGQLNQLDQQIALTKKEYEGDKRINAGNVELLARKKIIDQLNATGKVDPSINYFDEAMNEHRGLALTDKSDHIVIDFKNARKQDLFGKYTDINKAKRRDQYDWKTEYYPDLYDFKDNGEAKEPTMTTKSQPSGFKDENNMDIPMLSEEAYGFLKTTPSNIIAIDRRLEKMYPDLDFRSPEAEKLRRIEAFKDVDAKKPLINKAIVKQEAPIRYSTTNNINMPGSEGSINKVYERIDSKINSDLAKGFTGTRFNALANDEQDVIKKAVETAGREVGESGENVFLKKDDTGKLKVYRTTDDGKLIAKPEYEITTLSYTGTNLPKQTGKEGKVQTVKKGESGKAITPPPKSSGKHPLPSGKPRTVKQNGHTYTWNEQTGNYE